MFGHDNTYTGTRLERNLRKWGRNQYDRARHAASDTYDSAAEHAHSWRSYLPHFSSRRSEQAQQHHHGYVLDAAGGLCCFLLGAAAMYFFDPQSGRRRRAIVRDKFIRAGHVSSRKMRYTGKYLGDRTRGMYYETARMFHDDQPSDQVLCQRIRARMGRYPHGSRLRFSADNGCVTISGSLPEGEIDRFLKAVESVPGVKAVENGLEAERAPAM